MAKSRALHSKTPNETVVTVVAFGADMPGGIQVDSCNACEAIPSAVWEKRTRTAINNRMSSGGADKGRVLYARHRAHPKRELAPVAAATIHLAGRQIRILHLGYANGLVAPQQLLASERVIQCVIALAREHGCGTLEWVHHTDREAKACCRQHNFTRVRRSAGRYAGLRRNDWLVDLRLDP